MEEFRKLREKNHAIVQSAKGSMNERDFKKHLEELAKGKPEVQTSDRCRSSKLSLRSVVTAVEVKRSAFGCDDAEMRSSEPPCRLRRSTTLNGSCMEHEEN